MEFIPDVDKEQIKSISFYDQDNNLKFDPAVYLQRYMYVLRVINHKELISHIKKVAEFGCAEMQFFTHMRHSSKHLEKIVQVDIDSELLEKNVTHIKPLNSDYLNRRNDPFRVEIYEGSVAKPHRSIMDCDAVVAIELIEHVYPDVLEEIPYNIFSFINPKIVVLTTPNADFNVLFPGLQGFRHDDHKFEWTRQQFQDWCNNICVRYPEYVVQYHHIGRGPEGTSCYGCVSQMALFIRKDILDMDCELQPKNLDPEEIDKFDENYNLIHCVDYPFFHDDRTHEQIVMDEAEYHLNRLKHLEDAYYNYETRKYLVPLKVITGCSYRVTENVDEVRTLLATKYNVDKDFVILDTDSEQESDY